MALTAGTWKVVTQVTIAGASIAAQGNASPNTLAVPSYGPSASDQQTLTFGTTSGKANILCAVQNTLAGGASATYDLFANGLAALYNQTANFLTLRGICIVITSGGDASGLRIGNAAANATQLWFGNDNDTWTIFPSGPPFAGGSDAGVVIDATNRNLKLENLGAASVTFAIFLAGASV